MAVRNALYAMLLYQDLRQSGKIPKGQKFPPIVPIVLYNGSSRWTASMDVSDLIEKPPPGLEAYRPHMRYLLVDEHRYLESELRPMQNVVAALFRLEKSRQIEDVRQVIQELSTWLHSPEQQELRRAFANWLCRILLPRLLKKKSTVPEFIPEMNDLEEVRTMLAETAEGWTREWKQEEAAVILLKLIRRKFGQAPDWMIEKVHAAQSDLIETWSENVIFANSLDDVFAS